jgi:hypothetical protein
MALWRRLRSLTAADRRLVAEAAWLLLLARVGLWVLSYRRLVRALEAAPRSSPEPVREAADRVAWAVTGLARRLPGMTCLVQSLAAHALLLRRGCPSQLHIGVQAPGPSGGRPLEAHAWVVCERRVVVGAVEDLGDYAVLTPSAGRATPATPNRSRPWR